MGITSDGQKHEIKEKSLVAAKTAFFYTGIIRATVPIPVFFGPKFLLMFLQKYGFYPKNSFAVILCNSIISGLCLYVGLSSCISFFP